jgi:hypothetical protein
VEHYRVAVAQQVAGGFDEHKLRRVEPRNKGERRRLEQQFVVSDRAQSDSK